MKHELRDVLCCPICKEDLEIVVFKEKEDDIDDGLLLCKKDGAYPIKNGIPRLDLTCWQESKEFYFKYKNKIEKYKLIFDKEKIEEFLKRSKKTKESFGFEWRRYYYNPEDDDWFKEHFINSTGLNEDFFKGKLILDVGCGMGRYPRILSKMGAEVIGLELSDAIERVKEVCDNSNYVHPIQGDLMQPPFKEGVFDYVYSMGVLHHTPDVRKSFSCISNLPKKGGHLSIQVYQKIRREWFNSFLRFFTTKMPKKLLYYLCYLLVPIPKIPVIRILLKPIPYSSSKRWQERLNDNFDWYSPKYQHHHTSKEVVNWFYECGYEDVKVLPKYQVSVIGIRR